MAGTSQEQPPGLTGVASCLGLDPRVAHSARIWNYWLGGKDHYPADRAAGDAIEARVPGTARSVRETRAFAGRVVRYLAGEHGIGQFLDIGAGLCAGLPCADPVHEIAWQARPDARVVYADSDPLVMAHARALLRPWPGGACGHVQADARDPADLLAGAARTLDLAQPAAVLMISVLDFIPDTRQAQDITRRLMRPLAAGSFLVICHLTARPGVPWPDPPGPGQLTPRTPQELTGFLGGLDLVPPGVVPCSRWHPGPWPPAGPPGVQHSCGVARKAGRPGSAAGG